MSSLRLLSSRPFAEERSANACAPSATRVLVKHVGKWDSCQKLTYMGGIRPKTSGFRECSNIARARRIGFFTPVWMNHGKKMLTSAPTTVITAVYLLLLLHCRNLLSGHP